MKLDRWQNEFLKAKGNIVACTGRQVGKSTITSIKAAKFAVEHEKKTILIISATERQSLLLFEKVLAYIHENNKNWIKKGKDKPTKHTLKLTNGSVIHSLPTGLSGYGIRGYTIDLLIADEAAYIPEDVWTAVTPMLATTAGTMILLSTPKGKQGYFYRCFQDEKFTKFHVNTKEIAKEREDPQKTNMLEFLEAEEERMSIREYAQEYLGQFIDEFMQFFPDDLIKQTMTLIRPKDYLKEGKIFYLGVDIARLGGDETTFEIFERRDNYFRHIENIVWKKIKLTDISNKIILLNEEYNFRKIYIDDGGIGVGVLDTLLEHPKTKRKTEALNNSKRSYNYDPTNPKTKQLLKEDLYNNLLRLMEQGKIRFLDDGEIFQSFKSVQYEFVNRRGGVQMKIFGNYTHIVEGIIRAAWGAKEKSLNLSIHYI